MKLTSTVLLTALSSLSVSNAFTCVQNQGFSGRSRNSSLLAANTDVDAGGVAKAGAILGAGAVALGLIITSPFADPHAPGALSQSTSTTSKPKNVKVVRAKKEKVQSAPKSTISKPKVSKEKQNVIGSKKSSSSQVDGYNFGI